MAIDSESFYLSHDERQYYRQQMCIEGSWSIEDLILLTDIELINHYDSLNEE